MNPQNQDITIKRLNIYVTAKNGLVGKNLLENEDLKNHNVFATSHGELDLTDYNAVKAFLNEKKPEIVIHCAGLVGGIQANINRPYEFFLNNVLMGINVVRASYELGIKKFLNLSSSCSYPRNYKQPLKEEYVLQGELEPTNEGYALAKLSILKMCEYISRQFEGYQYKTLIPCNLYGRFDKFSPKNSHMIPSVIRKLHEAKEQGVNNVDIWGDGKARREFMYAGDLADGISYCINNFDRMPALMNIGLGYDYTVDEYYETIAKVVGYSGKFNHDLTKPAGMKQKLVDISRQTEFGWKPKHTLEEGIIKTYDYFLNEYKGE